MGPVLNTLEGDVTFSIITKYDGEELDESEEYSTTIDTTPEQISASIDFTPWNEAEFASYFLSISP